MKANIPPQHFALDHEKLQLRTTCCFVGIDDGKGEMERSFRPFIVLTNCLDEKIERMRQS